MVCYRGVITCAGYPTLPWGIQEWRMAHNQQSSYMD